MPITGIRWNREIDPWDIHVLRNENPSIKLNKILVIDQSPGDSVFATTPPTGVDVKFMEQFIGGPTNFGVEVDRATGSVKVKPTSTLTNFVIHAIVKDTNVTPAEEFETAIRVQIHGSVTDVWLTPNPLTVRRNTSGIRFTILARFDDNVIGVIPSDSNVQWFSDTPDIQVEESTGEISAGGTAASAQITAQIDVTSLVEVRSAQVNVVAPWSTPTEANWISANKSKDPDPENVGLSENINLLFIPDGFTRKSLFDKMVLEIVEMLQTSDSLAPFNLLSESINYWSAFISSREAGTTVMYDMNTISRSGVALGGEDIPFAEKSPSQIAPLTLAQLIYRVGMPIPTDKTIDFGTKLIEWSLFYGVDLALRVDRPLFDQWQNLSEHFIANEKDTALGIKLGNRPNVSKLIVNREPGFHPFRTNREQLDQFLSNITFKHKPIGTTWTTGKDRRLVVILLGGSRYGGAAGQEGITVGLRKEQEVVINMNAGRVDIQSYPVPTHVPSNCTTIVAHETAHVLGCGDEYGEFLQLPDRRIPELSDYGNVQDGKSLLGAAGIDGNKMKWLWHRITKAGVLKSPPHKMSESGGIALYKISLKPKHSRIFDKDITALLRRRPPWKFPDTSDELYIGNVNKDTDVVDVTLSTGADLSIFGAGSILFIPIKNPSVTGPDDLRLVAPNILEHINTTHGPLNADFPPPRGNPGRACNAGVVDSNPRQKAKNLPTGLPSYPRYREWITGLFEGGHSYYCGAYHPSGVCIMRRRSFVPGRGKEKGKEKIYSFCHVCKYILVDRLDPTKHGEIDELDYGKERGYKNKYPFRL